jgi:hypothetical protein
MTPSASKATSIIGAASTTVAMCAVAVASASWACLSEVMSSTTRWLQMGWPSPSRTITSRSHTHTVRPSAAM